MSTEEAVARSVGSAIGQMHGLDDWLLVARTADADELRERILTGYKSGYPSGIVMLTYDVIRDAA